MKLRRTKIAAITAVAALSLVTSACGGSDTTSDASTPSGGSGTSASPANDELTTDTFSERLVSAQQKARTSHVEMVVEAGGQKVTASGDQRIAEKLEDNAAAMTMDYGQGGPDTIKITIVDGEFYMNFGKLTGGKYAKADLSDPSDPFTQQLAPILEQLDTSQQVEALSEAVTSIKKKGDPETIDGVEAQPYEVTVDTSRMAAFQDLPRESRSTIPKTLVYTMFLGPDDLLRRMTYGFGGMTGTVTLSKWGEPVDISAPGPGELSDKSLSTLLRGASV